MQHTHSWPYTHMYCFISWYKCCTFFLSRMVASRVTVSVLGVGMR